MNSRVSPSSPHARCATIRTRTRPIPTARPGSSKLPSALLGIALCSLPSTPALAAPHGPQGLAASSASVRQVSVFDYGAKGDGITEDSLAIQAALDAGAGGTVQIPPGTFKVSRMLRITAPVTVRGAGRSSVILFSSQTVIDSGVVIESDYVQLSDLRISGSTSPPTLARGLRVVGSHVAIQRVWFDGAGAAAPSAGGSARAAISLESVSDVAIEDCDIAKTGPTSGVDIAGVADIVANYSTTGGSTHLYARRNHIYGSNANISVAFFDTSDSSIEANEIDQNNRLDPSNPLAGGYGILLYTKGGSAHPCSRNLVLGNRVQNTAGSAIYLQGSPYSLVASNIVHNSVRQQDDSTLAVGAIALSTGYPQVIPILLGCEIAGNIIENSGKAGISIAVTRGLLISGNHISGVTTHGIQLRTADTDTTIGPSNYIEGGSRGISVAAGTTCTTIQGNTIVGSRVGILLAEQSKCPKILANTVRESADSGIRILGSNDANVANNLVVDSLNAAGEGLRLAGTGARVTNNQVVNGRGIAIRLDPQATLCTVARNSARGMSGSIAVQDLGSSNRVEDNDFVGSAVPMVASPSTVARGNRLSSGPLRGTATLVGGTATVKTPEIRASDRVELIPFRVRGARGQLAVTAIVPGVSFVIGSTDARDTSVVAWDIIH